MDRFDVIFLLQVLIWLAASGAFFASNQASIFHPCLSYLAFHGIVFVVRPFLVHYLGFRGVLTRMMIDPSEEEQIRALWVTSLALVLFVAAGLWAGRCRTPDRILPPVFFSRGQIRALQITSLVLLPIIALSMYITRNGIDVELRGGAYIIHGAGGYVNDVQKTAGSLICCWLVASRFRSPALLAAVAYLGYRAWYGQSRWTIVTFVLAIIMSNTWYHRRKWPPLWTLLVLVALFPVFHVLGENRDYFKSLLFAQPFGDGTETLYSEFRRTQSALASRLDRFKSKYDVPDFANFDMLCYVLRATDRSPSYTYGSQYLQLLTEPIPRQLWKSKPVGSPIPMSINLGAHGDFLGYTVTLPGDAWMTGGWAGVVIVLALAGWACGRAYRLFWEKRDQALLAMLYIAGAPNLIQMYRDGGIVSISKFLLFSCASVVLWIAAAWLVEGRFVRGRTLILARGQVVRLVGMLSANRGRIEWTKRVVVGNRRD